MRFKYFVLPAIISFSLLCHVALAEQEPKLSKRLDVQQFIQRMVSEDHFDPKYLDRLFDKVELQPSIIPTITKPAEGKDWPAYKTIFISDKRVADGYQYWKKHVKVLDRLQERYGVPPSIVVAVLGTETFYGDQQGQYRVMDVLTTLAFDYPPRQAFFRKELAEYLRLVREYDLAPFSLKGSYAGAIGMPQFMPSSYRYYAVTYEGNHSINLQKNNNDIMASVANYLKKNGWHAGEPILAPVSIAKKNALHQIKPNTPPTKTLRQLYDEGFHTEGHYNPDLKANIVMLNAPGEPLYYMGFNNFYTILRYNVSPNYGMAVYTLSHILEECWQEQKKSCHLDEMK